MSKNWDFYMRLLDGKPASIFVDLGIREAAPMPELPFMAYIRLSMKMPRDNGLSSNDEFDTLVSMEKLFEQNLVGPDIVYVGRCTTNGCRDFFFYVAAPQAWPERVASCMSSFPGYTCEADTRDEPDWPSYFEYLYPTDADMQSIENRHVCDSLKRNGDLLKAPRDIDHWASFPSAEAMNAYVAEAAGQGYQVRVLSLSDAVPGQQCAQLWRCDVPSANGIDEVTMPLYELALKHGGEYDGWECAVVRQDQLA